MLKGRQRGLREEVMLAELWASFAPEREELFAKGHLVSPGGLSAKVIEQAQTITRKLKEEVRFLLCPK